MPRDGQSCCACCVLSFSSMFLCSFLGRGGKGNKYAITVGLPQAAVINCADNSGAKNLFIVSVMNTGGRLNRLPSAGNSPSNPELIFSNIALFSRFSKLCERGGGEEDFFPFSSSSPPPPVSSPPSSFSSPRFCRSHHRRLPLVTSPFFSSSFFLFFLFSSSPRFSFSLLRFLLPAFSCSSSPPFCLSILFCQTKQQQSRLVLHQCFAQKQRELGSRTTRLCRSGSNSNNRTTQQEHQTSAWNCLFVAVAAQKKYEKKAYVMQILKDAQTHTRQVLEI